jgi:uncharacterized membrane protein (UPF0136 family)
MRINGILYIVYALLLTIGGMTGYLIKGSLPSLIAAITCGPLLLFIGLRTLGSHLKTETAGLLVVLLLDVFFTYRLIKTASFMPAGLFVILSTLLILTVCYNIKKRISKMPNQ